MGDLWLVEGWRGIVRDRAWRKWPSHSGRNRPGDRARETDRRPWRSPGGIQLRLGGHERLLLPRFQPAPEWKELSHIRGPREDAALPQEGLRPPPTTCRPLVAA